MENFYCAEKFCKKSITVPELVENSRIYVSVCSQICALLFRNYYISLSFK